MQAMRRCNVAEHPNATWVREAFQAAIRGDPSVVERIADDVEWHEIGRAEPVVGIEAVLEHLAAPTDWVIHPVVHDVVAGDTHAVVLINARATRAGRTLEYRVAEIYDLRDGKVAKRWAFSDETERIVEFFRQP